MVSHSAAVLDRLKTEAALANQNGDKPILERSFQLAIAEIERLHRWVIATSESLNRSGLTLEEYNAITRDVKAAFSEPR